MSTKNRDYSLDPLACVVIGLVLFFVSLTVESGTQLDASSLNGVAQITVQLFGFGGVIFAVLYHEQRSMLSKHRVQRNREARRILDNINAPVTEPPSSSIANAGPKIVEHDKALLTGADIYMAGRHSFFLGFMSLAICLILELFHMIGASKISLMQVCNLPVGSLLVSAYVALITTAVTSFAFAIIRSMDLPLNP